MTDSQGTGRHCIFCGRRRSTSEHVIPAWVSRMLDLDGPMVATRSETPDRLAVTIDTQVRRVCATCNNGWLSQLEKRAQGLLQPLIAAPVNLYAKIGANGQMTLAAWFYKTALMADFAAPGPRVVPNTWHRAFRETVLPPDSAAVYMAAFMPDHQVVRVDKQPLLLTNDPPGSSPPMNRYAWPGEFNAATISVGIGRLLFQVLVMIDVPEFQLTDHKLVTRLWPPSGRTQVFWPPSGAILRGQDVFQQFATRTDYGFVPMDEPPPEDDSSA